MWCDFQLHQNWLQHLTKSKSFYVLTNSLLLLVVCRMSNTLHHFVGHFSNVETCGWHFQFMYKGVLQQLSVQALLYSARPCPNHCQMVDRVLTSGAIYEACGGLEGKRGKEKSNQRGCPLLSENVWEGKLGSKWRRISGQPNGVYMSSICFVDAFVLRQFLDFQLAVNLLGYWMRNAFYCTFGWAWLLYLVLDLRLIMYVIPLLTNEVHHEVLCEWILVLKSMFWTSAFSRNEKITFSVSLITHSSSYLAPAVGKVSLCQRCYGS